MILWSYKNIPGGWWWWRVNSIRQKRGERRRIMPRDCIFIRSKTPMILSRRHPRPAAWLGGENFECNQKPKKKSVCVCGSNRRRRGWCTHTHTREREGVLFKSLFGHFRGKKRNENQKFFSSLELFYFSHSATDSRQTHLTIAPDKISGNGMS